MENFFLLVICFVGGGLIFAGLQRRFSPETLAQGFMDEEKGSEIAPTVFQNEPEEESI